MVLIKKLFFLSNIMIHKNNYTKNKYKKKMYFYHYKINMVNYKFQKVKMI